jgi:hypothetical protein
MKSKKGNPNYYNIRFLYANEQEGHPRDSQGWFTIFLVRWKEDGLDVQLEDALWRPLGLNGL